MVNEALKFSAWNRIIDTYIPIKTGVCLSKKKNVISKDFSDISSYRDCFFQVRRKTILLNFSSLYVGNHVQMYL